MADVLDQSEVDALLAAVETGGVETASDRALVSRPATPTRDVHAYDFKRPERVSKEQMRALEGIHESFGRSFGAFLSGFLRTIVEIRLATAEQLTYSEFIHSLPNPTNFNVLTAEPLEGQLCLEISPLIIYPIIDRLLGGSNSELFIPQRPLTLIEQRLVGRITDRALTVLTESWSELVDVKFKITEVESNPHLVQMVAPNEVVVVLGFEIKMAGRAGTMSLCIPFNVIEPAIQYVHRRVVGVDDLGPEHFLDHPVVQWPQQRRTLRRPVAHRRAGDLHPMPGQDVLQPGQGQMIAVLTHHHIGQ